MVAKTKPYKFSPELFKMNTGLCAWEHTSYVDTKHDPPQGHWAWKICFPDNKDTVFLDNFMTWFSPHHMKNEQNNLQLGYISSVYWICVEYMEHTCKTLVIYIRHRWPWLGIRSVYWVYVHGIHCINLVYFKYTLGIYGIQLTCMEYMQSTLGIHCVSVAIGQISICIYVVGAGIIYVTWNRS